MDPEHMTCGAGGSQGVQHRKNRRHPNPGAEENKWLFTALQNKASARRTDVERFTRVNVIAKICAGGAIRFGLNANAVALRRNRSRQRVAAVFGGCVCCWLLLFFV